MIHWVSCCSKFRPQLFGFEAFQFVISLIPSPRTRFHYRSSVDLQYEKEHVNLMFILSHLPAKGCGWEKRQSFLIWVSSEGSRGEEQQLSDKRDNYTVFWLCLQKLLLIYFVLPASLDTNSCFHTRFKMKVFPTPPSLPKLHKIYFNWRFDGKCTNCIYTLRHVQLIKFCSRVQLTDVEF